MKGNRQPMKTRFGLFALALAPFPFLLHAQTPAPTVPPAPPPATLSDAVDIDPTVETDNPTLLKAQIVMLRNAIEAKRTVLSQLVDFQQYDAFQQQEQAKEQKLNRIIQLHAAKLQADNDKVKAAKVKDTNQSQLAADNEVLKKAAAAKAKAAADGTPAPK